MEAISAEKDANLTPREQEIMDFLLEGMALKEIAATLKISLATVDFHRNNLYRKLGIQSQKELFTKYLPKKRQNLAAVRENAAAPVETGLIINETAKKRRLPLISILGIIFFTSLFIFLYYSLRSKPDPAYIANWYPTNDKYSESKITKVNKEINGHTKECIMISGVMSGYKYAFSGASSVPFSSVYKSLWTMKSVSFKVLGDGNKYFISFPTNETADGDRWLYEFTTVKDETSTVTVRIPEDLTRKNWSLKEIKFNKKDVTSIQIQALSFGRYDLLVWDILLEQ